MNRTIKARWVAALKSGDFTQGTHTLAYQKTFCCLGVLCHIQDPLNTRGWRGEAVPPRALTAGLTVDELDLLVEANDDQGWKFWEIAEFVDATL